MNPTIYAWCFSHGRLHVFADHGAWCTGNWVDLGPGLAGEAMAEDRKRAHFGDARFLHELPAEAQEAVMGQAAAREVKA